MSKSILRLCFAFAALIMTAVVAGCQNDSSDIKNEPIQIKNSNIFGYYSMKNPLGVKELGDPFILYDEGYYYMYATSIGTGFKVWKTSNPTSWSSAGVAYSKSPSSFGEINYWAPEVYKYNGKYYMFYSAQYTLDNGKTRMAIGCASSESPTGPFTDMVPKKPLFSPDYSVIDANVLFDKSGKIYLYYARDCSDNIINGKHISQIYGVELSPDFKGVIGEPVLLATPTDSWETASGNYMWNEGPCVFERNGKYYMMYSANYYEDSNYSVGCAVSDSPLGEYKKYKNNPVLKGDGKKVSGSGHNNIFSSPDGTELYTVYHSHTDPSAGGGNRQLCIDKVVFDEKGILSINGPTVFSIPIPSGTAGTTVIKHNDFTVSGDVKTVKGGADEAHNGILKPSIDRLSNDCWLIKPEGNPIKLEFNEAVALEYISLYIDECHDSYPSRISLVIDGKYVISDVECKKTAEPTVFSFRNLPEGTKIEVLEFYFSFDDDNDSLAVKEIIPVQKK